MMNLEKFKSAELNAQEMKTVNGGDLWGYVVAYHNANVLVWTTAHKIAKDVSVAVGNALLNGAGPV